MKTSGQAGEKNSIAMSLPVCYRDSFPETQAQNLFPYCDTVIKAVFLRGVGSGASVGQEGLVLIADAVTLFWRGRG